MERTIVALFDTQDTAQDVVQELLSNGFDRSDISLVRTNQQGDYTSGTTTTDTDASGAAAGAGIGAALGGLAGLLVGLGALAIPGVGPIIAAGPLATALAGAGLGAATGGLVGALADTGIPENEAGYYSEGVRRGGTLLTVRAREDQVSRATEIMNRYSPVDINERATEWKSSGWTGFDADSAAFTSTAGTYAGQTGATGMGGTTGMTGASTGRFEDFDKDFRSDWESRYRNTGFDYSRYQPAYRYGWQLGDRYQGQDWNTFERDVRTDWERMHPNDRWEDFKDSIRMGWERFKRGAQNTADDVRQGAREMGRDMERGFDRTMSGMNRNFDAYDTDFRSDWQRSYRSSGYNYERYQPAYQYGYTLASDTRYRGRDWNDFEAEARRDWERSHPADRWEDFKDAVQHAWNRVRGEVRDALD